MATRLASKKPCGSLPCRITARRNWPQTSSSPASSPTTACRPQIARSANIVGERATHGALFDFINRLRGRDPDPCTATASKRSLICTSRNWSRRCLFIWQNADEPLNVFNVGVRFAPASANRADRDRRNALPDVHYENGATGWVGVVARFVIASTSSGRWVGTRLADEAVQCTVRHAGDTFMKLVIHQQQRHPSWFRERSEARQNRQPHRTRTSTGPGRALRYSRRARDLGALGEHDFRSLAQWRNARHADVSHLIEPYPLGTAAGMAKHLLADRFLVFYGDVMLDMDLGG